MLSRWTTLFLAASTTLALAAGCNHWQRSDKQKDAAETTPPEGKEPPLAAPAKGVAIEVKAARQRREHAPLQVSVVLANGVDGQPIILTGAQFQLKTADGLLILPKGDDLSPQEPGNASDEPNLGDEPDEPREPALPGWIVAGESPRPDVSLAGGASVHLRLQYDLSSRTGVALLFTEAQAGPDGKRRSVEVPVTVEACTMCGTVCTFLDYDANNCGACGVTASACLEGKPIGRFFSDVDNCGAEGRACDAVLTGTTDNQCYYSRCNGSLALAADHDPEQSCAAVCEAAGLTCNVAPYAGLVVLTAANQTTHYDCTEPFGSVDLHDQAHCVCIEK